MGQVLFARVIIFADPTRSQGALQAKELHNLEREQDAVVTAQCKLTRVEMEKAEKRLTSEAAAEEKKTLTQQVRVSAIGRTLTWIDHIDMNCLRLSARALLWAPTHYGPCRRLSHACPRVGAAQGRVSFVYL